MIIAIDPGKNKCGIAIVTVKGEVIHKEVIKTEEVKSKIIQLKELYDLGRLIIGDGTMSREVRKRLEDFFQEVLIVDESYSTLEARDYYWEENPPTGLRRLIPLSLQTPPELIDDYVAVILAKRELKKDH